MDIKQTPGSEIEKILLGGVRLIKKNTAMGPTATKKCISKKRPAPTEPDEEDTFLDGDDDEDDFESIGTSDSEIEEEEENGGDDAEEMLLRSDASEFDTDPDCSYDEGMETTTTDGEEEEEEEGTPETKKKPEVVEIVTLSSDEEEDAGAAEEMTGERLVKIFDHAIEFGNMIKSGYDFEKVRKALRGDKGKGVNGTTRTSIGASLKRVEAGVHEDINNLCARMESVGLGTAADLIQYASECWSIRWKKINCAADGTKCALTGAPMSSKRAAIIELDINLRKLFIRESTAALIRGDRPIVWEAWRDKKETQLKSPNPSAETFFANEANEIIAKTTRLTRTFVVKPAMVYPTRLIMFYGLFADHGNPHILKRTPKENADTFEELRSEVRAY